MIFSLHISFGRKEDKGFYSLLYSEYMLVKVMVVAPLPQVDTVRLAAFVENPENYKESELYVLRSDRRDTLVLPTEITYGLGTDNALERLLAGVFSVEEYRITRKASPLENDKVLVVPKSPILDYILLDGEETIGWLVHREVQGAIFTPSPIILPEMPVASKIYYYVLLPEKPASDQAGQHKGEFLKISEIESLAKRPEVEHVVKQYLARMKFFMAE